MSKYDNTIKAYMGCLILIFIFWFIFPSTYLKDGDYILKYIGFRRPIHYLLLGALIKLLGSRLGYFIHSEQRTLVVTIILLVLEVLFRLFAYIRSSYGVTKFWVIGFILCLACVAIYGIDRLKYDVKFEGIIK